MTIAAATAAISAVQPAATKALGSLAGNFQDFLKLLMTQLQNQDPTSPMGTNQFTNQLVQFADVEQQINTNGSLTKLIEATQGNAVLQSAALVGKQVQVASDQLALQGGKVELDFNTAAPQPVNIGIYSDKGAKLQEVTVSAGAGSNSWAWDGRDSNGTMLPDGSYRAVVAAAASGTAIPFTITGTATGMQRSGDTLNVELGALKTSLSNVQAVGAGRL